MHYLLFLIAFFSIIFLPQWWVKTVLQRYNRQDENFPGTGSELARHLLDRFELKDIKVEVSPAGDHYDPEARCIRLTRDKYDGKTLTAITVAAHEFGHALQHAGREDLFMWRWRLARQAEWASRIGSFLLFSAPFLAVITKAPSATLFNITGAMLVLGYGLLIHLFTLPVEFDASFSKALPILQKGYLSAAQNQAARKILQAASLTYVAGSLVSLLNFWRWLRVFRR